MPGLPELGELRVHPAHLVGRDALLALELWREWRGGGMAAGHLPEAGGTLHQAACLYAAFAVLSDAWSRMEQATKAETTGQAGGERPRGSSPAGFGSRRAADEGAF